MLSYLKNLCLLDGISGRENNVRDYILKKVNLSNDTDRFVTDAIGNLIIFKKGRKTPKNKVMISAHMDEVGFIVTYICDNGFLKFTNVGGVDSKVACGRAVSVGENGVTGIIGQKAMHLCTGDEGLTCKELSSLYIDIGADSKEEAEKLVSIGDSVHFKSDYVEFGGNKVKAKAIDDRFGCAVMLKMLEGELEFDTYFAFLVQEEVGCRGAGPAVCRVRPDYAIVLEATTASDIAFVAEENRVCIQGKGAVVSFMDRSTVYDMDLFKGAFSIAERNGIKIQPKTTVAGGNDAGTIHKSCEGVKTIAVSLPCRYIHSGTCVADIADMDDCYNLAVALLKEYANA